MSRHCLSDDALVSMCLGEADAAARTHVRECLTCAARLREARRDLEAIGGILRAGAPARRVPRRRRAAVAAAGVGLIALGGGAAWVAHPWAPPASDERPRESPLQMAAARGPAPAPAPSAAVDAETVAFLDQVATALSSLDDVTASAPAQSDGVLSGVPGAPTEEEG